MRQSFILDSMQSHFLEHSGKLCALNFGSDSCAEHEWGIKELQQRLGCDPKQYGVERRRIRDASAVSYVASTRTSEWVGFQLKAYATIDDKEVPRRVLDGASPWFGWSERSFGAFAKEREIVERLTRVYSAIANNNACIWVGGGGPFGGQGLVIGIISDMDPRHFEAWGASDKANEKLQKDADDTGIIQRLRDADKRYICCSPHRNKDGALIFWLNTFQPKDRSGWYSVEELDQWTAGTGPVVHGRVKEKK